MEISSDSIIAIVGAGTMGAGIAQIAAAAGHAVRVIDSQQAALDRGRASVDASLASLLRRGSIDEAGKTAIAGRIVWTPDIFQAAGAALAIEAIVERLDAKKSLFDTLTAIVGPTAMLASNTSSLSIQAMAQSLANPERFVGLHFFNPVPAMKLVEVIAGPATAPAVANACMALMRNWGKRPVAVRDVPGFIVNRVARPYYGEGFAAFGEGIAPAAIDHALTAAGGFRMGPLALADLIGHDVNFAVASSVYDAYAGQTRFRPQPAQQALFESGRFGRKSGSGVYDYPGDLPQPDFAAAAVPQPLSGDNAGRLNTLLTDGVVEIAGVKMALGDGRPLTECEDVAVLIDHARDFATAPTLVMTARDTSAEMLAAAFARATGRRALFIADRPGQIVLRTLAQLANAAADAVADDVAGADGIDEALVYGANHPEGPLQWAARFGFGRVSTVLSNIARSTDDSMYRPADWFGVR